MSSFKEKLNDKLGAIEDRWDRVSKDSEHAEKKFLENNNDRINSLEERKDKAAEKLGTMMDKAGGFFNRMREAAEEKKARAELKRAKK